MKQVVALLLVALSLVILFAVFTGGGNNEPDPLPPITNVTKYNGTIGVILPSNSTIGEQVRNGIDTAYLLQDTKRSVKRGMHRLICGEQCMWL